jgi:hypothetical protein
VQFAKGLPVSSDEKLSALQIVNEIIQVGQGSVTNNNVFIPVLQALLALLQGGLFLKFGTSEKELKW